MLKVKIIAHTPQPEKVIAMAAKLCYSPVGVDQIEEKLTDEQIEKFISHLVDIGHESPFEHASFTFAIEGIDRSVSHQLVRHRLASYSQQSQRYVTLKNFNYEVPPEIKRNPAARKAFSMFMDDCKDAYNAIFDILHKDLKEEYIKEGMDEKKADKKAEKVAAENARGVLPNACETKLVTTMNVRELFHFFSVRCCDRAQEPIREMAKAMLIECKKVSPVLFKNCGPECVRSKCPEGSMSCGKAKTTKDFE